MEGKGLTIYIGADITEFQKKMKRFQRNLKKTFGRDAINMSKKLAVGIGVIGTAIGALGVASIKAAADMEQQEVAFETLLGSSEKAKKLLGDIEGISSKTPFQFPELVDASKKLLAFKFNAEDIPNILTTAGDAASGLGLGSQGIERITLALGQMSAKGKLSGEEMRQLSEAGINAWDAVADAIGVDVPSAMKMAEKGMIDSATGINAILNGMQKDFGGMMAKQSQTFWGLFSTLKDNIGIVIREIGNSLIGGLNLKEFMSSTLKQLQYFTALIKEVGLKDALLSMIPDGFKTALIALAGALTMALVPAFMSFGAAVASALVPLIPFIMLGGSLAYLAVKIHKHWADAAWFFEDSWIAMVGIVQKAWSNIKILILSGVKVYIDAISKITRFIPGIGSRLNAARESISNLINEEKLKKDQNAFENHQRRIKLLTEDTTKSMDESGNNIDKAIKKIKDSMSGVKDATKQAAFDIKIGNKEAAKSFEELEQRAANSLAKLKDKAVQLSQTIESEWISATKTDLEQLELRFNKQREELEKTKDVNQNYQRDLLRMEETYQKQREEILNRNTREQSKNIGELKGQFKSFSEEFKASIIDSVMTGENKISDFIENMKKKAIESGINNLIMPAINGLFGGMGIPAMASGGVVSQPTIAMIGEKPGVKEAVVPLTDSVLSKMGGGSSETKVIINNYTGAQVETQRNGNITEVIIGSVKKGFQQGKFDREMGRYGARPQPGY